MLATRAVGIAAMLVGLAFTGRALVTNWDEARAALAGAHLGWLLLAWALSTAGAVLIAMVWGTIVGRAGGRFRPAQVVQMFFKGEAGKYVPGGVWAVVGRAELATRRGLPRATAYGSVALSMVSVHTACALVSTSLLALRPGAASPLVLWVVPVLAGGLVVLHPRVWRTLVRLVPGGRVAPLATSWRATIGLVLRALPVWAFVGTATWCVAQSLDADAGYLRVLLATTVSWLGGFLVVPAPGGLGVREGIFVALLDPVPAGAAAAVAVVARLLSVITDATGLAGAAAAAARPAGAVGSGVERGGDDVEEGLPGELGQGPGRRR